MKTIYNLGTIAIAAIIAFTTAGCHKSKREAPVTQQYQVDFADSQAHVAAWFTIGSSSNYLQFTDRSLVTANGIVDSGHSSTGTQYFGWSFLNTNEVVFVLNKNGSTLINKASRSSVGDITLVMDSVLSVNDTMRVSFTGSAIDANEYIGVAVNRNSDSTNQWSGISAQFTGTQCTLDFSQTRLFYPGIYTVQVTRRRQLPLQQADGGGGGYISVSVTNATTVTIK